WFLRQKHRNAIRFHGASVSSPAQGHCSKDLVITMALDSTSFAKQWEKADPYFPQIDYSKGLAMRSSREQSHDKMSSGPAGPDNRQLKDPMGDTGHWREKLIPREKIAEILRAIHNHQKEVLLGLAKTLAKVNQRRNCGKTLKIAIRCVRELTAVQARLNGMEFVEPADQDGSEEQEQSGRAKWLQQSSPDGDARFVRDTAAEEPEPRTLLPSHALPFYNITDLEADLPAPVFRSLQWRPDQEIETSGYLNAFCCPPTAFCS
ncbi:hypothetical protein T07_11758, partial [Trichinella nelsoni]